ncbi:f-box domain-containing protein [Gigaspora margarita]|uniref:F-box domain-containing protein n=1 Tax=Gigaspora margarita TaxID=4874 RepID=A0A8H4ESV7_GIGMA|nr:f-box domain-containing protein [Gigaspora margarita]
MIRLSNECFLEIFSYLKQYETLFSCLLVSRQWFRFVAPILWSKPLKDFSDARIIRIYLSLLNIEEQVSLIPFDIILPNGPKPLINYASFTVSYENSHLNESIEYWIEKEGRGSRNFSYFDDEYYSVTQTIKCSLIAMLLRTSERLKSVTFKGYDYGLFKKTLQ